MAAIDKLVRAKRAKNNEYYTKYEDVKFFVENSQIKDYLRDKTVYLPCDTEDSHIYKYLVDNKQTLGIKEILRTSDDYYDHLDLYEKSDVVFTNPPFTGIRKWLSWLDERGIKYISWMPMMGIYSFSKEIENIQFICWASNGPGGNINDPNNEFTITNTGVKCVNERKKCMFNTRDGEKTVSIYIISNDKYFTSFEQIGKSFSKNIEEVKDKLFRIEDGYEVCNGMFIPNNLFDEYLYIPITSYIGKQNYVEYIEATQVICKDGKTRPRIKVKLKKDEINNKIKQ